MRTKIIEIIGPPGVGKTTLYHALCKSWKPGDKWIYQDLLLADKPRFSNFSKWMEFRFRQLLKKKLARSLPTEYGLQFIAHHQKLAGFYWNQLSDEQIYSDEEIDKRFRSAFFLFTDFCRYEAIMERHSAVPCIINEGLLQKSFVVQNNSQQLPLFISQYLPLLPLPHAIIYLNTWNMDLILERLSTRKKIIASHAGKNRQEILADISKWQYQFQLMLEWMQGHNVPVYTLDAEKPVAKNVSLLKTIFKQQEISKNLKTTAEGMQEQSEATTRIMNVDLSET
jgi:deoxyadenosine/deoxycytidine kinase